jgi:Mrp family chromosome partitioning ATPase
MRIVTGNGMRRLIEESALSYEWVIVDTPPVALLPDAHVLAAMVDRVLLVIEAGKTPYDVIQKSIAMIGKERIVGTVLNRADSSVATPYDGTYDKYYSPSQTGR